MGATEGVALTAAQLGHIAAQNLDRARETRKNSGEDPQEGCFAATTGAEKKYAFAASNRQIWDIEDFGTRPVGEMHVPKGDCGICHLAI